MKGFFRLFIGMLSIVILTGCASMEKEGSAESWDDQQISRVIQERLSEDFLTSKHGFQVRTAEGVVSLYGYVPEMNAHARAVAIAESSPGVVRVVDHITD